METTIFGPPGTGKTTTLIKIVESELKKGTPPDRIAFVSFSKILRVLNGFAHCTRLPFNALVLAERM
jgi:GTPase SAR1 family protein